MFRPRGSKSFDFSLKMSQSNDLTTFFSDPKYKRIIFRRKFIKRLFIFVFLFGISLYISVLLFGDIKSPRVVNLTELDRCPACYGVSICPELYSNQITLENHRSWSRIFNAKNVYYGNTKSNRRVVIKKLAHDWELRELDTNLCKSWGLNWHCKPMHLMNSTNIDQKIINLVKYNFTWPETVPRKGLIMCPYAYSLFDFVQPILNGQTFRQQEMLYIWTMLTINPEPIVLQVIPKSKGWPLPAYGGVCGRLELVGYEGEPISSLLHIEWHRKLKYALKILDAAMDFTFRHERFRFYLMDWSLDNIVANEQDEVTFIDLEDVLVLDKHISPKKDLPDWYKRYNRQLTGSDFTFSIENMCKHHLSDHNLWAACFMIAGQEAPLLYPIPKTVNDTKPQLDRLLHECLHGTDRFSTVTKLQHLISDVLQNDIVLGYRKLR